jgi:hypothetical protein
VDVCSTLASDDSSPLLNLCNSIDNSCIRNLLAHRATLFALAADPGVAEMEAGVAALPTLDLLCFICHLGCRCPGDFSYRD